MNDNNDLPSPLYPPPSPPNDDEIMTDCDERMTTTPDEGGEKVVVMTGSSSLTTAATTTAATTTTLTRTNGKQDCSTKLQSIIAKAGGYPSFTKLLAVTTNYEISDDGDDDEEEEEDAMMRRMRKMVKQEPSHPSTTTTTLGSTAATTLGSTRLGSHTPTTTTTTTIAITTTATKPFPTEPIIIDVDVALGLKAAPLPRLRIKPERIGSSSSYPKDAQQQQQQAVSFSHPHLSAADEGYYEGVRPMMVVEDHGQLSPMQQWIRRNMEYFSATTQDVQRSSARRMVLERLGRVGVRCIHCAKAVVDAEQQQQQQGSSTNHTNNKKSIIIIKYPAGAVSYPASIATLYTACSQRTSMHFPCANLPPTERHQWDLFVNATQASPQKRTRLTDTTVPSALYYTIAAKMIGLVDHPEGDGMRFARDLTLDPLPFEEIREQVVREEVHHRAMEMALPVADALDDPTAMILPMDVSSNNTDGPRSVKVDEAAERVLAHAIMEMDDPRHNVSRGSDKGLVSDYMFLTIRQMAICHAMPLDFASKGKKTKVMRLGLAGFCCKHCTDEHGMPSMGSSSSCRSFTSIPENLTSAISNSFAIHLQKCPMVPTELKRALTTYKRLHTRQMANKPYGSQRRLFLAIWERLRAADISEEEMQQRVDNMPPPPPVQLPPTQASLANATMSPESKPIIVPQSRPEGLPTVNDPLTLAMLYQAEENFDPAENDNIILPNERWLVTDFVFLMLRQLRVAIPDPQDLIRTRRLSTGSAFAGLCCVHCQDQPQSVSPSGRTFPSAPDNFASALNSSLNAHMQACTHVPANIRHALSTLRKIHSAQCASLRFGSQRRYFNLLYERLLKHPGAEGHIPAQEQHVAPTVVAEIPWPTDTQRETLTPLWSSKDEQRAQELEQYGYMEADQGVSPFIICQTCRMVPIQFRASWSLFFRKQSIDKMRDHQLRCKKDSMDLETMGTCLEKAISFECGGTSDFLETNEYKTLISTCVAGDGALIQVFADDVKAILHQKKANLQIEHSEEMLDRSKGLWATFPQHVDGELVSRAFVDLAKSQEWKNDRLPDHRHFSRFLSLIAPGLTIPSSSSSSSASSSPPTTTAIQTTTLSLVDDLGNATTTAQEGDQTNEPSRQVPPRTRFDDQVGGHVD